jgi:NAD(P)-dependent dehydrogenase (short-subunit alcohol dehydrogenase family)
VRIIVTAADSGVGRATAAELAADGHDVVVACRNTVGSSTIREPKSDSSVCSLSVWFGAVRSGINRARWPAHVRRHDVPDGRYRERASS